MNTAAQLATLVLTCTIHLFALGTQPPQYWLGHYTRTGAGQNQTVFVPATPPQKFGPGAMEGHGFFSAARKEFVWWGWAGGRPPREAGVPAWDSCLTLTRVLTYDAGLAPSGDFNGSLSFYPVAELASVRTKLLLERTFTPSAAGAVAAAAAGAGAEAAGVEGSGSGGVGGLEWLDDASGNCLDIELNITWPSSSVPANFGTVGVKVLGDKSAEGGGGVDLVISNGPKGAFSLVNGGALAPAGSSRPRPPMLSLRVLVDRSIVEAYAQGGRATSARAAYLETTGVAAIWQPPQQQQQQQQQTQSLHALGGGAATSPVFSMRVWAMGTAHVS